MTDRPAGLFGHLKKTDKLKPISQVNCLCTSYVNVLYLTRNSIFLKAILTFCDSLYWYVFVLIIADVFVVIWLLSTMFLWFYYVLTCVKCNVKCLWRNNSISSYIIKNKCQYRIIVSNYPLKICSAAEISLFAIFLFVRYLGDRNKQDNNKNCNIYSITIPKYNNKYIQ